MNGYVVRFINGKYQSMGEAPDCIEKVNHYGSRGEEFSNVYVLADGPDEAKSKAYLALKEKPWTRTCMTEGESAFWSKHFG